MHTYVEVITDEIIREYVDDEMIDERANPRADPRRLLPEHAGGQLAVGCLRHRGSHPAEPGYNEKATEISDILNYHSAPVTVITGAKAQNLEKGPRKVWSIPNAGAKVTNLSWRPTWRRRSASWSC